MPVKPIDRLAQRAAWHELLEVLCLGGPEPPPPTPTDDDAPTAEPAQLAADARQGEAAQ